MYIGVCEMCEVCACLRGVDCCAQVQHTNNKSNCNFVQKTSTFITCSFSLHFHSLQPLCKSPALADQFTLKWSVWSLRPERWVSQPFLFPWLRNFLTLQMSNSLTEGGGAGIHIYTQYNMAYGYTMHNSNNIVQCPHVLYCSMFVVIYIWLTSHTSF